MKNLGFDNNNNLIKKEHDFWGKIVTHSLELGLPEKKFFLKMFKEEF